MKKLCLLIAIILTTLGVEVKSQVRIGKNASPTPGAILDLHNEAGSGYIGGLLLPKVELTNLVQMVSSGIGHEAELTGLVVYNTSSATEGVYIWIWNNSTGTGGWKVLWKKP